MARESRSIRCCGNVANERSKPASGDPMIRAGRIHVLTGTCELAEAQARMFRDVGMVEVRHTFLDE